jgi:small-conductance mechanosensitive channel
MRRAIGSGITAIFLSLAGVSSLRAQDAAVSPEIETLTMLPQLIRPEGLVASLFIIAGAWLLLRFVKNLVSRLGEVFAERRLLLQRLSAIFHFLVYITTIVTTVLLSFEISRELLTLLGGAAAVAIGFAVKDLVRGLLRGRHSYRAAFGQATDPGRQHGDHTE